MGFCQRLRQATVPFLLLIAFLQLTLGQENPDLPFLLDFKASFPNGNTFFQTWQTGLDPCVNWTGIVCGDVVGVQRVTQM